MTRYAVELSRLTPTYHSLWMAQSWRNQDIVLPALPAGYDASAEWGAGTGRYRAIACSGWDQHFVSSRLIVVPKCACGYGQPVEGSIFQ